MSKETKKERHAEAISYADKAMPRAKEFLDIGTDAPSIQREWIKLFREKLNKLWSNNADPR